MRTGVAVVSSDQPPLFLGEVLELISGPGIDHVLSNASVLDVHYIRKLLSEV